MAPLAQSRRICYAKFLLSSDFPLRDSKMNVKNRKGHTVQRRQIWQGSVGSFGLEEVILPNGRKAELAVLNHPGAAAVVPFLDDERIILLWQYRHAAGGMIWEIPAGKLEPDEEPAECIRRELIEETGYSAQRIEQTGMIHTTPGFSNERIYLFCAYGLVPGHRSLDADEVIETYPIPIDEVLAMVSRGEITDAKTIAALFHVVRRS